METNSPGYTLNETLPNATNSPSRVSNFFFRFLIDNNVFFSKEHLPGRFPDCNCPGTFVILR